MILDLTKPIQTIDGRNARILCTNLKGNHPIVVAIEGTYRESVISLTIDGKFENCDDDLFIINIGDTE